MTARQRITASIVLTLFILTAASATAQLTFQTTTTSVYAHGLGMAPGDFNEDSDPDLAVGVAGNGGNFLDLYIGSSSGQFTRRLEITLDMPASMIHVGDLNHDGHLDVVIGDNRTSRLEVYLGDGHGSFTRGRDVPLAAPVGAFVLADLNNDGIVDVAALECDASTGGCQLVTMLNTLTTYAVAQIVNVNGNARSLVAADFNQDGKMDLATAVSNPPHAQVYLGAGNGTIMSEVHAVFPTMADANHADSLPMVVAGDFNHDGVPDLAVLTGSVCGSACGIDQVRVMLSDGAGNFNVRDPFTVWNTGGGGQLRVDDADLNGDGITDLLYFNSAHFGGGTAFWLGKGDGSFLQSSSNFTPTEVADGFIGDVNRDGRNDVVVTTTMGSDFIVALNTATGPCGAPATPRTVHICAPASGSTVASPVHIDATARPGSNAVTVMQVYVDGVKKYEQSASSLAHNADGGLELATDIALPAGAHHVTVQALDASGAFKAATDITVGSTAPPPPPPAGCAAPSTARTVVICSPTTSQLSPSPVHVTAAARPGSSAIKVMQIYVDGVKQYEKAGTSSIDTTVPMTAGSHRLTVQAIDSAGAFKASEPVYVSAP